MIDSFSGINRFLSNFYYAPITCWNIRFPTNEHAFVVAKLDLHAYQDPDSAESIQAQRLKIAAIREPGAVKRYGRQIPLRSDWEDVKIMFMRQILDRKFSTHPSLLNQLLVTNNEELVEGNTWHDQYWGNCTCPKHADTPGHNVLGKLLMEIRELEHIKFLMQQDHQS